MNSYSSVYTIQNHHWITMYFAQTVLAALLAATSTAVGETACADRLTMAAGTIFENMVRNCDYIDTQCVVEFTINSQRGSRTPVRFITSRTASAGASRSNGHAQYFGDYAVTSGWSGQFGWEHGFTTFSVVDVKNRYGVFFSLIQYNKKRNIRIEEHNFDGG